MSEWTVHLVFEEGTSSKFWRARVDGKTLIVNYGKIGSTGQKQVKDFADTGAATAEYDKLVREKRKKGYHDTGGEGGATAAPAEEPEDDADEDDAEPEDEADDDDSPRKKPAKPAAVARPAAAPSAPGHRLVLDAGNRKVTTTLYLDGQTLRMDSVETYASPDAASKAFERLKRMLAGEGYKP